MSAVNEEFEVILEQEIEGFTELQFAAVMEAQTLSSASNSCVTAQLRGFCRGAPILTGLPDLPTKVVAARTSVALTPNQIGSAVVVVFEQGNKFQPIVIGVLREHQDRQGTDSASGTELIEADIDGDRIIVGAQEKIELRCGKASITLTKAGKVLIKGEYVLSHSTGVNCIKGGSVRIN
ncbi:DUF6484 domain-containing protein [Microvirga sp. 0TCS3.31]